MPNFHCLLHSKWKTENVKLQAMIHRQNVALQISLTQPHFPKRINLHHISYKVLSSNTGHHVRAKTCLYLGMYKEDIWTHRYKWFFKDLLSQESLKLYFKLNWHNNIIAICAYLLWNEIASTYLTLVFNRVQAEIKSLLDRYAPHAAMIFLETYYASERKHPEKILDVWELQRLSCTHKNSTDVNSSS